MKNLPYILLGLFLITFTSCRDVVELDVEAAEPELVVNGMLTNNADVYVDLQSTAPYFENQGFKAISNARVSIFENGQEVVVLDESNSLPGHYEANFRASFNKQYQLRVEVVGTNYPEKIQGVWLTKLDTLRPVPPIDSMKQATLNRSTTPQAFFEGEYALMYFGDFPGKGNYYRIKRKLNDSLFAQENIIINDENVDGIYFGQGLFPPIAIYGPFEEPEDGNEPDSLTVFIQSVSADFEDYLNVLQSQVQTGSPFDAPPAMVVGNIHKEGNEKTSAFGYFQTVGVRHNGLRYTP